MPLLKSKGPFLGRFGAKLGKSFKTGKEEINGLGMVGGLFSLVFILLEFVGWIGMLAGGLRGLLWKLR